MRVSRTVMAGIGAAGLTVALAVSVAGCGGKQSTTPKSPTSTSKPGSATSATSTPAPTSAPAQPNDYAGLLIKASDIDAPVPFTGGPVTNNPNGQPGAAITFSTDDNSHQIKDTIAVLADPAAATNALNAAKGDQGNAVKSAETRPFNVGTGGTTLAGKSPDGSKGVEILLFTQGRAFVTLEFDGPAESLPPEDFVTGVGQKQLDAVKKGLGG